MAEHLQVILCLYPFHSKSYSADYSIIAKKFLRMLNQLIDITKYCSKLKILM